jgi:hypothetical protein
MSIGLTQLGASVRGLAFAMAQRGRVDGDQVLGAAAADALPAWALKPVQPGAADLRGQVLAERGLDRVGLMQLTPQARYRAEVSIDAETALRTRQAPARATGAFLDLRV